MRIILASKSPRRKDLLNLLGLNFEVITADIDETINLKLPVCDEVARLSFQKAKKVAETVDKNDLIISADTVVEFNGSLLGKPKDKQDAFNMLSSLSGHTHSVLTAVTVLQGDKRLTEVVTTGVTFANMEKDEINSYIETGEPMDKAGAYGIQGKAAKFVLGIEGDYYNVVGLPLSTLYKMLKQFDINL